MSRKLNLTVSGALQALADSTPGRTSYLLTRLLLRAAPVIEDARPELSAAEREIIAPCLGDLLLLRPDELPSSARLAAELRDVIGQCDVWPAGVRAGIIDWVARWPLAAVWALVEDIEGMPITRAAEAGMAIPRGRPKTAAAD